MTETLIRAANSQGCQPASKALAAPVSEPFLLPLRSRLSLDANPFVDTTFSAPLIGFAFFSLSWRLPLPISTHLLAALPV